MHEPVLDIFATLERSNNTIGEMIGDNTTGDCEKKSHPKLTRGISMPPYPPISMLLSVALQCKDLRKKVPTP